MRDDQKLLKIKAWVRTQVNPSRFEHIQGVAKTSGRLARRYKLSTSKASLAAWLHDCAKELPRDRMERLIRKSKWKMDQDEKKMPGLWHPHAGAALAVEKWGVKDPAVLEAIRCHTLGKAGMGPLAQVLFTADFIEPGRKFPGVASARRAAGRSLTEGVVMKSSMTIQFLFEKRMRIHPRLLATWNHFMAVKNEK